jgi:hypothetical protein
MQRTHTPSSQHLVRDAHSRPSRNAPSARAVTHAQPSRSCPRQVPAVRHALENADVRIVTLPALQLTPG